MRTHASIGTMPSILIALTGCSLLAAAPVATAQTRTLPGTDITATECVGCGEAEMRSLAHALMPGHHHFYDVQANVLRAFRKVCESDPVLGRPGRDDRARDRAPRTAPEPSSWAACPWPAWVFETTPDARVQEEFDAVAGIWRATNGTMKANVEVPIGAFEGIPGGLRDARELAGNVNMMAAIEHQLELNRVGNPLLFWLERLAQRLDRVIGGRDDIVFRVVIKFPDGSSCSFTASENAGNQVTLEPRSCTSSGGQWIPAVGEQAAVNGGAWSPEPNGLTLADWATYFRRLNIPVSGGGDRILSCSWIGDQPMGCVRY